MLLYWTRAKSEHPNSHGYAKLSQLYQTPKHEENQDWLCQEQLKGVGELIIKT